MKCPDDHQMEEPLCFDHALPHYFMTQMDLEEQHLTTMIDWICVHHRYALTVPCGKAEPATSEPGKQRAQHTDIDFLIQEAADKVSRKKGVQYGRNIGEEGCGATLPLSCSNTHAMSNRNKGKSHDPTCIYIYIYIEATKNFPTKGKSNDHERYPC